MKAIFFSCLKTCKNHSSNKKYLQKKMSSAQKCSWNVKETYVMSFWISNLIVGSNKFHWIKRLVNKFSVSTRLLNIISYMRRDFLLWIGYLKLKPVLQMNESFFSFFSIFCCETIQLLWNCSYMQLSYVNLENCQGVLNINLVCFTQDVGGNRWYESPLILT